MAQPSNLATPSKTPTRIPRTTAYDMADSGMTNRNEAGELSSSVPTSPSRTIHFESHLSVPDGHSQYPPANGSAFFGTSRPRLLSTATFDDSRSAFFEYWPKDCATPDCAFGWGTYVFNHDCKSQESTKSRVSIHQLLHEGDENPLLDDHVEGKIRYVHLPANNMQWVEDLFVRYYYGKNEAKHSRLVRRNLWYGQQHGHRGPVHARFMRPRCDVVPEDAGIQSLHKDFVIAMPYLHWETDEAREKMRLVINDIVDPGIYSPKGRKISDLKLSTFGQILIRQLKKQQVLSADPDEKLLRKHLLGERPVHIRRTLDQSYYWTVRDTQSRDRDQVVYRATNEPGTPNPRHPRVVMVDQLWLWVLDGEMVISSCPRRWGREKSDESGVYRTIRAHLTDHPNIENVYDLAILIMDQCSRVFFDHTLPRDNRPEVIDIFANAIGDVTDRSTQAYARFWDVIMPDHVRYEKMLDQRLNQKRSKALWNVMFDHAKRAKESEFEAQQRNLQRLLDINPEGELLKEIKDVLDELHMMTKIYNEQYNVVKEFSSYMQQLAGSSKKVPPKTKNDASRLVNEVARRKAELNELTKAAEKTADGLKELLDLKHKHANVALARETNNISENTMNLAREAAEQTKQAAEQTKQGTKQNRSMMIFTIVTIIFLPLGFFSSVFGMNAPEFGQGDFHIWKQFAIMFPISIAVILFSLALALSNDTLKFVSTVIQLLWARFLRRLGLFELWKRRGRSIRMATEDRQNRLNDFYKEPSARRETV